MSITREEVIEKARLKKETDDATIVYRVTQEISPSMRKIFQGFDNYGTVKSPITDIEILYYDYDTTGYLRRDYFTAKFSYDGFKFMATDKKLYIYINKNRKKKIKSAEDFLNLLDKGKI